MHVHHEKIARMKSRGIVALVVLVGGCAPPSLVRLSDGIWLRAPKGWAPVQRKGMPVTQIALPGPGGTVQARVLLDAEERASHQDALRRLAEIAAETGAPARVGTVGGWPALMRVRRAPLPVPAAADDKDAGEKRALATVVTTAIAAGDRVVRTEGWIMPAADPALVGEVAALAGQLELPRNRAQATLPRETQYLTQAHQTFSSDETVAAAPGAMRGSPSVAVNPGSAGSEISVAVSADGNNLLVANNSGYTFSTNGGGSFTSRGAPLPFANGGDPSVAASPGIFYYALLGRPNGNAASGGVTGCSASVATSVDNGATFTFAGHAAVCGLGGPALQSCFPDQESIASDPVDGELYLAWRDMSVSRSYTNCALPPPAAVIMPTLICSGDRGATWGHARPIGIGDTPRVTVGPDGDVFVLWRQGANVMLSRFSPCNQGLVPAAGFPVLVATIRDIPCPPGLPGLDRCDNLSSAMVAVDDLDASRVYVAFAEAVNDGARVLLRHSFDGGRTFSRSVAVDTGGPGDRFLPWVCSTGGMAFVSWYDRRGASFTAQDATAYFSNVATTAGPTLVVGRDTNLSGVNDLQCASGFPNGNREMSQCCPPNSCSRPPNLGAPKYGDYNGNACAAGRLFSAWASATAPAGVVSTSSGIRTWVDLGAAIGLTSCGDRICEAPVEDCGNCPGDCGCPGGATCMNRRCAVGTCGDGFCNRVGGENCANCGADCGCRGGAACVNKACQAPAVCGDGVCVPGVEDCANCGADCGCPGGLACVNHACSVAACGNGVCDFLDGENCASCAADCGCPGGTCVNGGCQSGTCGDGVCQLDHENCANCAADCGCPGGLACRNSACSTTCGDGFCDALAGENCGNCGGDCKCAPGRSCNASGACVFNAPP